MKIKNLFLSIIAIILAVCLVMLLFLATNQQALAKVHQTINTFSNTTMSTNLKEDVVKMFTINTAKASEKQDQNEQSTEKQQRTEKYIYYRKPNEFSSQECNVMASNYAQKHLNHHFKLKQVSHNSEESDYIYTDKQHQTAIEISKHGDLKTDSN